jgi:hypothetical protein
MVQIRIENISGTTYPVNVFLADVYGNNRSLLGVIDPGPVPPAQQYNITIPPIFETAPEVMLLLVGANGCELFKILECTYGCAFEITINLVSCIVNITITEQ